MQGRYGIMIIILGITAYFSSTNYNKYDIVDFDLLLLMPLV